MSLSRHISLSSLSTETCAVGDVNGDHAANLVAFNTSPDTWVALAPSVVR